MLILLQKATGPYFGEFLFCVLWKVAFHHPVIVLRFCSQHISNNSAFVFTKIENTNGVKFFITSQDANQKPISFSLRQRDDESEWKLIPGSLRWLYEIEQDLSDAIVEMV